MVSVSLKTRDPDTAKKRARARRVEFDNELAALERAQGTADDLQGSVLFLTDAAIDEVCDRYRAKQLADDELLRIKGLKQADIDLDLDLYGDGISVLRAAFSRGDLTDVYRPLEGFMRELKLSVSKSSPSYERLARRFQQEDIEVHEAILRRRQGLAVPMPSAAAGSLSIDDVFLAWKRHKGQNPKTVRAFEQAFEDFKTFSVATTATLVRKSDVVSFRDALLDRNQASPKTIEKQLSFLRAAFQVAVDDDKLPANPFAGVKMPTRDDSTGQKPRLPYDSDELSAIFSGAVYQPGFAPRPSLGDACRWLPLLGLFTGARLEELAQLDGTDIEHDRKHGAYICIRRAVDRSKRTKNLNSVRNFPVHPRLIQAGFLDYMKAHGKGRLFPALRADKYGILSTSFSTWYGRYLDELGIIDPTRVFHSLRHTFIQRAKERAAHVPPEVREAIVGHLSTTQIEMVYGTAVYPLEPQVEAMRHIDWPELDLTHLVA